MKHITKPWGWYVTLLSLPHLWIKLIFVEGGHKLSLQSHAYRKELWLFLKGKAEASNDGVIFQAKSCGNSIFIPKCAKHRLVGITGAYIIELAWGKPKEDDIIRYEDDYERTTK
jgi:mannose-6-phosphate isomerase-like protein (cupin superfamily)